jgi:hypothetical protein
MALALVVIGTSVPFLPAASASASSAQIKAIPHESRQDVGKYINLEMRFSLDTGNPISVFQVTVDQGTASQKVLLFNAAGQILPGSDPIFSGLTGSIHFKNDGYYGPSSIKGMFMTKLIKSMLTVGTHQVNFEVKSGSQILASDNTDFVLKAAPQPKQANLEALALFGELHVTGNGHDKHAQQQQIEAMAVAKNGGTKGSGPFETALYVSTKPTLDSSATLIAQKHTGNIGSGDFSAMMFNEKVSLAKGTYYLIVQLDSTNVVDETTKTDNTTHSEQLIVS